MCFTSLCSLSSLSPSLLLSPIIMETAIFPKIEQHFNLHDELLYLEDYLHLQRSYEDAITPTYNNSSWDTNFKFDFSTNYLPQHPISSTFSSINQSQINFENLEADFHLWNECPPLSEEAWQPISQLPPTPLPYNIDTSTTNNKNNNNPFSYDYNDHHDQFLLPNINNINDQSLGAVVAEGYNNSMLKQGVKKEENIFDGNGDNVTSEHEKIMRFKGNNKIESINYEEIRKYFDQPITKAAKELNVGLTVLKKRCRELNIKRWPHRKIKSLEALICNVKELGRMDIVEALEEHKKRLQKVPGLELTEETKKLRQACFKANYKKRRALALA